MKLFEIFNVPLDKQRMIRILSLVALLAGFFSVLAMFAEFLGVAVLLLGVVGTISTLRRSESAGSLFNRHRAGFAALGAALVAHLLVLAFSVQLFLVPAGSDIRPMGWAWLMFVIAFNTFVVVWPIAVIAITQERPRLTGLIGLILGFTPFWFAALLLRLAVWMKGLNPSP